MKKYIFLIFAIIFMLVSADAVSACSCLASKEKSESKKVKTAYKQSAAVFYGEVTEVTRQENSLLVKFKVEIIWKGVSTKEVIVQTAENSAMCGFNFEAGKRYLVYGDGKSENLQTNICSRTSGQDADKKYLNKIKKPTSFDWGIEY